LLQQVGGEGEDEGTKIVGCALADRQVGPTRFKAGDAFLYLQPVAGGAAQGGVHVRQYRAGVYTALFTQRNHGGGEFAGLRLGLHESGHAKFHVQDERIQIFGELLGKDGGGDEGMLGTVPVTSRRA